MAEGLTACEASRHHLEEGQKTVVALKSQLHGLIQENEFLKADNSLLKFDNEAKSLEIDTLKDDLNWKTVDMNEQSKKIKKGFVNTIAAIKACYVCQITELQSKIKTLVGEELANVGGIPEQDINEIIQEEASVFVEMVQNTLIFDSQLSHNHQEIPSEAENKTLKEENANLTGTLSNLQYEYRVLEEKVKTERCYRTQLEVRKNALVAENEDLNQKVARSDLTMMRCQVELKHSKEEANDMKAKLAAKEVAFQEVSAQLSATKNAADLGRGTQGNNDGLDDTISINESTSNQTEDTNDSHRVSPLMQAFNECVDIYAKKKKTQAGFNEARDNTRSTLESDIPRPRLEESVLKDEREMKISEVERLQTQCMEQQAEITQLNKLLLDKERQFRGETDSHTDTETLKKDVEGLETQINEAQQNIECITAQRENRIMRPKAAAESSTDADTKSVCSQTEDSSLQQVAQLTTLWSESERTKADLQQQLKSVIETHNTEVVRLKSEICSLTDNMASLKMKTSEVEPLCKEQQAENAELKEQLSDQESTSRQAVSKKSKEKEIKSTEAEMTEKAFEPTSSQTEDDNDSHRVSPLMQTFNECVDIYAKLKKAQTGLNEAQDNTRSTLESDDPRPRLEESVLKDELEMKISEVERLESKCMEQQAEITQLNKLLSDREHQFIGQTDLDTDTETLKKDVEGLETHIDKEQQNTERITAQQENRIMRPKAAAESSTDADTKSVCCQTEDSSLQQVAQLTTLWSESERTKADLQQQLKSVIETHNREIERLKSEICSPIDNIASPKMKTSEVESLYKEQHAENAPVKKQLSDQASTSRLAVDLENESNSNEAEMTEKSFESVGSQTEDTSKQQVSELTTLLSESERTIANLQGQLKTRNREVVRLKSENLSLTDNMTDLEEQLETQNWEIERLKSEKCSLTRNMSNLCKRQSNLEMAVDSVEAEFKESQSNVVKLTATISSKETQHQKDVKQFRDSLTVGEGTIERLQKKIEELKQAKLCKANSLSAKEDELQAMKSDFEGKEKSLREKTYKDLSKLRSEKVKLEIEKEEKQLLILERDETIDKQNAEIVSLKQLAEELFGHLDERKQTNNNLQQQLQEREEQYVLSLAEELSHSTSVTEDLCGQDTDELTNTPHQARTRAECEDQNNAINLSEDEAVTEELLTGNEISMERKSTFWSTVKSLAKPAVYFGFLALTSFVSYKTGLSLSDPTFDCYTPPVDFPKPWELMTF